MNPPPLRRLGLTAAAVAAILCWYLLTREPEATPRTAGKGMAPAALVTGNGAAVTWPKYGTDEFRRTLAERGEQWLNARGRDAENLIILFDLTQDNRLLDEARRRFPDDPGVWRALLQYGREPAWPWIVRLLAEESDNPDVHYLNAWTLLTKKWDYSPEPNRSAAIAALREASAKSGARDDHVAWRVKAAHDVALRLGIGPGDAVRTALDANPGAPAIDQMIGDIMNALTEERAESKAAGNEAGYLELTNLGLRTLDKFALGHPPGIMRGLEIANQTAALLAEIPDDTELEVGSGLLAAGILKQMTDERLNKLEALSGQVDYLEHLKETVSDQIMDEYYNRYLGFGQMRADTELLKEAEKLK